MQILVKKGINIIMVKRLLHTFVSLTNILAAFRGISLPFMVPEKFLDNKLMCHMWDNHWCIFSYWVGVINFIYFIIYSAIDIIEVYGQLSSYYKYREYLHKIASYLLFSIVFPLSMLMSIVFWVYYFYDREAIYPEVLDEFVPPVINHNLHTIPVPLAFIYMLISNEKEPPIKSTLPGLVTFMSVYTVSFYYVWWAKGVWVYPIFEAYTETQVMFMGFLCFISSIIFCMLGYKLNSLTHDFTMKKIK